MTGDDDKSVGALSAPTIMNCIARRVAFKLWWLIAIAICTIVAGAVYDLRVSIVGLMLLLIIFPMIMTFAVLGYATMPAVVALTRMESVQISDEYLMAMDCEGNVIARVAPAQVRSLHAGSDIIRIIYGRGIADILPVPRRLLASGDLEKIFSTFQPHVEM